MATQKIFFIVNPITRRYKQFKKEELPSIFPDSEYEIRVEETTYAGHETELAKIATKEDFDIVVVVGGDGTVHKVIQELALTRVTLGIAPTTPGSAFANFSDIPLNPMEAIKLIKKGNARYFDVGRVGNAIVGERLFLCYMGLNFTGLVAKSIAAKKRKSIIDYPLAAIKAYFKNRFDQYTVDFTYHRKTANDFEFSIANVDQLGGGLKMYPFANAQDGIFEILEIKKQNFFSFMYMMQMFFSGKPDNISDVVEYHKASNITMFLEKETLLQLDCEPYTMKGEVRIDMLSKSIRIFVPQSFNGKNSE